MVRGHGTTGAEPQLTDRAGQLRGYLLRPSALYDLPFGLREGVVWIGRAPIRAATSAGTP